MKHLALYLRAPLQSWGVLGKFGERTTYDAPTRSAVTGMLAAACGTDKHDAAGERKWLEEAAKLGFTAYVFRRGPRLTDYHTVGGGYDAREPRARRMIPCMPSGKVRSPDVTHRQYVSDSVSGAVLSGDDVFVEKLAQAVENPVWGVWFGRKCCIPTEPMLAGVFDSAEDAEKALTARYEASMARSGYGSPGCAVRICAAEAGEAEDVLQDVPVSFAGREYHSRGVARTVFGGE